jgi:hypothetical protein
MGIRVESNNKSHALKSAATYRRQRSAQQAWRPFSTGLMVVLGLIGSPFAAAGIAAPEAPAAAFARAGDGLIVASWLAPVSEPDTPIDTYVATAEPGGQQCQTSGSPPLMFCTISGLDNGSAYSVTVVAQNAAGISGPSTPSRPATPVAGIEAVNLVGTHGRVRWNAGFVGTKNNGVVEPFPTGVYNSSVYSGSVDEIFTAAEVNANASSLTNCSSSWRFVQILCDPQASEGDPGRNSPEVVWKENSNAGITFSNSTSHSGFVVVDLEQPRDFTTLRSFQMFSDGKVTDIRLSASDQIGEDWPMVDDGSWTELLPRSTVAAGSSSSGYVACPSIHDFGPHSARYLKLELWNSGEFGSPNWIEISAAKLFFESEPIGPAENCPLEPPTNLTALTDYLEDYLDVVLLWTPPATQVDSYQLQQSTDGGENWTDLDLPAASLAGDRVRMTLSELSPKISYQFRLQVSNENGSSRYSLPSNSVTPGSLFRDRFEAPVQ